MDEFILGVYLSLKTKNHVHLQHTLETPCTQVCFCKIKQYMYNFNENLHQANSHT